MTDRRKEFYHVLASTSVNTGERLASLSMSGATLVVFLRHGGCTFCREALADIRRERAAIERSGVRIVLVHMMEDVEARELFARFGLDGVARVSDPRRELYRAFGLQQGRLRQLLGLRVWWRGFFAGILHRHGAGALKGDGRQMPGVFLLRGGELVSEFRHRFASDRPDYGRVAQCALPAAPGTPGSRQQTWSTP
jgi:hypothetical protein